MWRRRKIEFSDKEWWSSCEWNWKSHFDRLKIDKCALREGENFFSWKVNGRKFGNYFGRLVKCQEEVEKNEKGNKVCQKLLHFLELFHQIFVSFLSYPIFKISVSKINTNLCLSCNCCPSLKFLQNLENLLFYKFLF